ncbi:MAG: restriction endonuclease [Thaumarchaeota archaeon]|nr:restriction endonuclease [Nitrososphaerota archaeon]
MSEHDLEAQTMAFFEKQGYKVRRTSGRDYGVDFYVETPGGKKFAIEVKTRRIGVPDVLSVASSNYSGTFGKGYSPVIVSSGEILPLAEQVASQNGVMVVRSEGPDVAPRLRFIESFVALVEVLAGSGQIQTRDPIEVINRATRSTILSPDDITTLRKLLATRNKVVHQREVQTNELEEAVTTCKSLITKLESKS